MKLIDASGAEIDTETMWVFPGEIESLVAEWNRPPVGLFDRRLLARYAQPATEAVGATETLPPIPQHVSGWLAEILAEMNRELVAAHYRPVDHLTLWRFCHLGRGAVSPAIAAALWRSLRAFGVERIAGGEGLKAIAAVLYGAKIVFPTQLIGPAPPAASAKSERSPWCLGKRLQK